MAAKPPVLELMHSSVAPTDVFPQIDQMDAHENLGSTAWPKLPAKVVKSAGRVLQILEYFDDVQGAANVVEIARALGFPQSSTSILLRSLVSLGYLHYDSSGRTYQPTSRVGLLGNWVEPTLFRGGALVQMMRDLNDATSDTVVLAARNGLQSQYIHIVQATTALRVHLTIGTTRSIVRSVTGLLFLSVLPELEVAKIVRRINAYSGPDDPLVKISDVNVQLEQIRKDGYAFCRSQITPGTTLLAVPLASNVAASPLALALAGPSERMESRKDFLLDAVRTRRAAFLGH
jgi:DNA-binding IclR family transcriptional regulator